MANNNTAIRKEDNTNAGSVSGVESSFGASVFTNGEQNDSIGEFGSAFGGTNAVSQIFKDASHEESDKKKKTYLVLGGFGLAALVAVGLIFFLGGDGGGATQSVSPVAPPLSLGGLPPASSGAVTSDTIAAPPATVGLTDGVATDSGSLEMPMAETPSDGGLSLDDFVSESVEAPPVLSSDNYRYNELEGGPVISASNGSIIEVSRDPSFSSLWVVGVAKNGTFQIPNPLPGTIYWRESGSGSVNSISISSPKALDIGFSVSSVSAGGSISWSSSGDAGFYRLELANDSSFTSLVSVLSTSKNSIVVDGVSPGSYYARVVGFNKASGRWEASRVSNLNVK